MHINHQNDVYRQNGVDDVIKVTPNFEKCSNLCSSTFSNIKTIRKYTEYSILGRFFEESIVALSRRHSDVMMWSDFLAPGCFRLSLT